MNYDPRRGRTLDLQVKDHMLYRLNKPVIKACSTNCVLKDVSGKDLPQRESDAHKQRGQEQRELTQVQPLCVAKPLKRSKWKLL